MLSQERCPSQSAFLILRPGRSHPPFRSDGDGPRSGAPSEPSPALGQGLWVPWSLLGGGFSPGAAGGWGPSPRPEPRSAWRAGRAEVSPAWVWPAALLLRQGAVLARAAVGFPPLGVVPSLWRIEAHPDHIPRHEQSPSCPTPISGANWKIVGEGTGSWLARLGPCLRCRCSGRRCRGALTRGEKRDIKGQAAKGHRSAWDFVLRLKRGRKQSSLGELN